MCNSTPLHARSGLWWNWMKRNVVVSECGSNKSALWDSMVFNATEDSVSGSHCGSWTWLFSVLFRWLPVTGLTDCEMSSKNSNNAEVIATNSERRGIFRPIKLSTAKLALVSSHWQFKTNELRLLSSNVRVWFWIKSFSLSFLSKFLSRFSLVP